MLGARKLEVTDLQDDSSDRLHSGRPWYVLRMKPPAPWKLDYEF